MLTVIHNGVAIHEDLEIPAKTTTAGGKGGPNEPGPLMLQDHGNPVQYRIIWIQELK